MKLKNSPPRLPSAAQQALLEQVRVVLVAAPAERRRLQRLLQQHHYLEPVPKARVLAMT